MQKIFNYFAGNPRQLFLLDSFGALLSAALLCLILLFLKTQIGVDFEMLIPFIVVAVIYAIYSFTCYMIHPVNWQFFLKIIATANILYSLAILIFVVLNRDTLSTLGMAYFTIESAIIAGLAFSEYYVAQKSEKQIQF